MYKLKNHMEEVVSGLIDRYVKEQEFCDCEKCRLDAMALALNELPPMYVVTDVGGIFAAVEATYPQIVVDVQIAVLKAIGMVKERPKH